MSTRVAVTLSDAMLDAVLAQARHDGQGVTRGRGRDYVIRKAVKAWLNKNRHCTTILDMDDESYAAYRLAHPEWVPGTRTHNDPAMSG